MVQSDKCVHDYLQDCKTGGFAEIATPVTDEQLNCSNLESEILKQGQQKTMATLCTLDHDFQVVRTSYSLDE